METHAQLGPRSSDLEESRCPNSSVRNEFKSCGPEQDCLVTAQPSRPDCPRSSPQTRPRGWRCVWVQLGVCCLQQYTDWFYATCLPCRTTSSLPKILRTASGRENLRRGRRVSESLCCRPGCTDPRQNSPSDRLRRPEHDERATKQDPNQPMTRRVGGENWSSTLALEAAQVCVSHPSMRQRHGARTTAKCSRL